MLKNSLIAFAIAVLGMVTGFSGAAVAGVDGGAIFYDITGSKVKAQQYIRSGGASLFAATSNRSRISYSTKHKPGSLIVDTQAKYLYLIEEGGKAIRYGIGSARPGFEWGGNMRISRKSEWPGWTPPAEMRKREPWLPKHMPGGPKNPLGARALYLGSSLYRIHGTNQGTTIGRSVSSGCIRMHNKDVMDLYERVKVGARVVVLR